MKRVIAILLVLLLTAFAFSACGRDDPDENGDAGSQTPPVTDSQSGEDAETEAEINYASKNVRPSSTGIASADLPEVPLLPDGDLPSAE